MSTAVQNFIAEVLKRWPPPKVWGDEQEEAWADDVIAEFANEKEPVFEQALGVLKRQSRGYSGTPRIEDVIKAVNLAVKEVAAQRQAGRLKLGDADTYDAGSYALVPVSKWDRAWTGEGVKLAYELLPTEMGLRAAREGWVRPLWCFVVVERRMPTEKEVTDDWLDYPKRRGLKAAAKAHDEELDRLARDSSALGKRLYAMAQDIVTDGRRLADIANGKTHAPKSDYFMPIGVPADIAKVKDNPPSKYADENFAEGRGWKGMTA